MVKKLTSIKVLHWLLWAWVSNTLLILPGLICSFYPTFKFLKICSILSALSLYTSSFGPILLMPLFILLIMTSRLAPIFYTESRFFLRLTQTLMILAAFFCSLLFVVSVATFTIPESLLNSFENNTIKHFLQYIVFSLWLVPAGMLTMLVLFMIQFSLLKETLRQGYKPLLIFIISGGLACFLFGVLATFLGLYFPPSDYVLVKTLLSIKIDNLNPILKAILNPYNAILLNLITPLPLLFLLKKCIIDKIRIKN